jgi:DNA-binding transcriptional ArsR family regulator
MREVERILKALANRRRLEILWYLKEHKEATVTAIASKIKLSFKATSKHLSVLYGADIVDRQQRSLQMFYRLHPDIHPIAKYISNSRE